jgi:hypothetical protein
MPPEVIFDDQLGAFCRHALNSYRLQFATCAFTFDNGTPCAAGWANHNVHQASKKGNVEPGPFQCRRKWAEDRSDTRDMWIQDLKKRFATEYRNVFDPIQRVVPNNGLDATTRLRNRRVEVNKVYHREWRYIKSNKTCLSCFQHVPDHVLHCGHAYCARCVQELGELSRKAECALEMQSCLLCRPDDHFSHLVFLKPKLAGIRVLSLDGGGVRGIVELTVMREIYRRTEIDIPVRDFFDLVAGTSTGKEHTHITHIRPRPWPL